MNYSGSYRRLRDNSKAAAIGAIEIYNKPYFAYRDEVFIILLINSWELLLKAIISKARKSIYYKKERHRPYKTLSWRDAFSRVLGFGAWPISIPHQAVLANLTLLSSYRDAAVHFYNAQGFSVIIYSLAQTSLLNYRDVLREVFGHDLADEVNWQILPLGTSHPIDPIAYLRGHRSHDKAVDTAVEEFLTELARSLADLEEEGIDTSRLVKQFDVSLQSIKKIESADIIVGIDGSLEGGAPFYVPRKVDPTISHPYRQTELLGQIGTLHGAAFSSWDFYAVRKQYGLDDKDHLCYQDEKFGVVRWSGEVVGIIRSLTIEQLKEAREDYRHYLRERRAARAKLNAD